MLVTAPNVRIARTLARAALQAKLVACVNLVPAIESHYWWQRKLATSREVLMMMKTLRSRLRALERLILDGHPYDTPEFLVIGLRAGSRRYLDWLRASVRI